jgi:hypothetical protein
LRELLGRCSGRFLKHAQNFRNELQNAGCMPANQYLTPAFASTNDSKEASHDVEQLGKHCAENHTRYMALCRSRMDELRNLSSELADLRNRSIEKMVSLAQVAHDVRRSSSFKQFLKFNLRASKREDVREFAAGCIVERLGKISRYYRAAVTIHAFGEKLVKNNRAIDLHAISTSRTQIPELSGRSVDDLQRRGGRKFQSHSNRTLQSKLELWPRYRLHCEIQLIVFYEEHPDLQPCVSYIACNKLSCYLCYHFIRAHGRFEVAGSHQSLYSLWTVPETVSFQDEHCANIFRHALRTLCNDLERKMAAIRKLDPGRRPLFPQNNESVANISRLSLSSTASSVGRVSPSTHEDLALGVSPTSAQIRLEVFPEAYQLDDLNLDQELLKEEENDESLGQSGDATPFTVESVLAALAEAPVSCSTEQIEPTRPMMAELEPPPNGDLGQDDQEDRDSVPAIVQDTSSQKISQQQRNSVARNPHQSPPRRRHRRHHKRRKRHAHYPRLPRYKQHSGDTNMNSLWPRIRRQIYGDALLPGRPETRLPRQRRRRHSHQSARGRADSQSENRTWRYHQTHNAERHMSGQVRYGDSSRLRTENGRSQARTSEARIWDLCGLGVVVRCFLGS